MRRTILGGIAIIFVAPGAFAADAGPRGPKAQEPLFVASPGNWEFSGEMIVRPLQTEALIEAGFDADGVIAARARARAAVGAYAIKSYYPETDEYVIFVPEGSSEDQVSRALMATGAIQYADPNWVVFALVTPNDPLISSQWHHNANRMNSGAGWDLHTGNPSVTVAVCDTGVQTNHPDLLLHRQEGYNASTQLWESQGGQIGATGSHGTQTTGCAAANGNNAVGVSGVGWNLSHRMMRVSEDGNSSTLEILTRGARVAVLDAGDRVANVSFSGVNNNTIRTTATTIKNAGGLLVWSAGNNGANLNWGNRDADDLIVVGATNSSDVLTGFSAFGASVDLVAPGEAVFTTTTGSSYDSVSGTSFSAPLTAGLIGLIWSYNPSLTPDEVEDILKAGCDDLGAAGIDNTYGYGRIDVGNSLSMATKPLEFSYPNGLPDSLDPAGGSTVRVEVLSGDANPIPGTGMLHYNDGGGWNAIAMDVVSSNVYDAVFPTLACPENVLFYFSAAADDAATHNDPSDAPNSTYDAFSASGVATIVDLNFESDPGWTTSINGATSGQWERGDPVNDGSWAYDPAADSDGSGQCWLTQNAPGNTDVDNGSVTLTTSAYDLSAGGVTIEYDYYLNMTDPSTDRLLVEISTNNGSTWTTIANHQNDNGLSWTHHVIDQSALDGAGVVLSAQTRLRFTANDSNPQSIVESGVDAFKITQATCADEGCPADIDGDGDADGDDFFGYLDLFASGDPDADLDGDGDRDADDFFMYLDLFAQGC
ncbi:MAG: S8 family serine peptidase [Phycisphaeraceae bacterium]|nr:S8 family serine peptidase [Phycisphaeraceae bacterium]